MGDPPEKRCRQCQEPLADRRKTYHPECVEAAREAAKDAMRRCPRCKKTKAASSFANDAGRADGKFPYCLECTKDANFAAKFQDSEAVENGHECPVCDTVIRGHANRRYCSTRCKEKVSALSKKFGLTIEQYRKMVDDTGGRCPLCRSRARVWPVDHNHRTRRVTGVVCTPCNVVLLAASRHDIERVERLLAYLRNPPADRLGIEVLVPEGANTPSNIHKMWRYRGAQAS